jgi:hypothetical protein
VALPVNGWTQNDPSCKKYVTSFLVRFLIFSANSMVAGPSAIMVLRSYQMDNGK